MERTLASVGYELPAADASSPTGLQLPSAPDANQATVVHLPVLILSVVEEHALLSLGHLQDGAAPVSILHSSGGVHGKAGALRDGGGIAGVGHRSLNAFGD